MSLAETLKGGVPAPHRTDAAGRTEQALGAFLGVLDDVLVSQPVFHVFAGAIETDLASTIWTWMARDVARAEAERLGDAIAGGADPETAFDAVLPELFSALKANDAREKADPELLRRNSIQMGGDDARQRLPLVIMALRRRPLLVQAARFGAAVGGLSDETAIANALQTITIANPVTRALWMQAMVVHMANPSRTLAAVAAIAGGQSETHMVNAGYGELVEAILCNAQSQIGHLVSNASLFSDIDFACKAIDRFHRLMRALTYNLSIERRSRWGRIGADLTGRISERLERPLQSINANITQALRKSREGIDHVDPGSLLEGLNGLHLLLTVRKSRDSLAVNAVLDKAWTETGQTLEVLITRALDAYRAAPGDGVARERIDAGIRMAEIRFNGEYADILRRARDVAGRRAASL